MVKAYAKAQGLWHDDDTPEPVFTEILVLIWIRRAKFSRPKRPQDRVTLKIYVTLQKMRYVQAGKVGADRTKIQYSTMAITMQHGDVVIAAITSCTNTSNPSVMVAAGLFAKKAVEKGLTANPG